MKVPKPTRQVIVGYIGEAAGFFDFTAVPDILSQIEQECAKTGIGHIEETPPSSGHGYMKRFRVNPLFDLQEVVNWILSLG